MLGAWLGGELGLQTETAVRHVLHGNPRHRFKRRCSLIQVNLLENVVLISGLSVK
jgi:hypothetical protein